MRTHCEQCGRKLVSKKMLSDGRYWNGEDHIDFPQYNDEGKRNHIIVYKCPINLKAGIFNLWKGIGHTHYEVIIS